MLSNNFAELENSERVSAMLRDMMLSLSLSLLLLVVPRPSSAEPWAQMLEDLAKQQGLEGDFNVSFYTP